MAEDFGNGVSRTLSALKRQFEGVVWQKGKPPLDSEFNLMSQIDAERMRQIVRSLMPSGFLMDPTRTMKDYVCAPHWSNHFHFGNPENGEHEVPVYAVVNGWVVPVTGTDVSLEGHLHNVVRLNPPPETDSRIDFVFLEVWQTLIAPNPSDANKPSTGRIYKYGNVAYGGENIVDDLEDPTLGFETTERVQIQYRIRVHGSGSGLGAGSDLAVYTDGLGDPNIFGQGTAESPLSGGVNNFSNMREELGDPSLWRAGDGNPNNGLGTIDGHVYAIPICAVFRRNSNPFVAVNQSGNPNQNGGLNRNLSAKTLEDPRDGARILSKLSLVNSLDSVATGVVELEGMIGSGLDDHLLSVESTFLVIGNEIIGIDSIDPASNPGTVTISQRGRYGTDSTWHKAGTPVRMFNTNPLNLYSDQIDRSDLLDLRRAVNPGDWDYHRLLQHNVASLVQNKLHSTWKQSAHADTQGPVVTEVSYLHADGSQDAPNHTVPLDGPDGIRTVWSDSAVIQSDITIMLDNDATVAGGLTSDQLDTNVGWDVGPDFKPQGFFNNNGSSGAFTNGSMFFLHLGGEFGGEGARASFRDGNTRAVRFVSPREFWKVGYPIVDPGVGNQYPVTLRFLDQMAHHPMVSGSSEVDDMASDKHPGPMFPFREQNFERPFIVLGGVLNNALKTEGVANTSLFSGLFDATDATYDTHYQGLVEIDLGVDFDTDGGYYHSGENHEFLNDAELVATPLAHGKRTLYDMLTAGGTDFSGASSELYVVLYGSGFRGNNGCFKVVGAGTASNKGTTNNYTIYNATGRFAPDEPDDLEAARTRLVCMPLDPEFDGFDSTLADTLTMEVRSQHLHAEDGGTGFSAGGSSLCIVLTDIGGLENHPWNAETLGKDDEDEGGIDNSVGLDNDGKASIASKAVLSLTMMYHPGRSAMARIPDVVSRFSLEIGDSSYLRQSPGSLDTTFSASSGAPSGETFFDPTHVQLWNRLPGLGWHAPTAPNYGANIVANVEHDREHELFIDHGSKSVIFRPFRKRAMTLLGVTPSLGAEDSLLGTLSYPSTLAGGAAFPKDGATIFTGDATSGKQLGYPIPPEFMPRFGRQDIPYYTDIAAGTGEFLEGINHLFVDSTTLNNNVFHVIGGEDNIGPGMSVKPMYFRTNSAHEYGEWGSVIAGALNTPFYGARKSTDVGINSDEALEVRKKFAMVTSSDLGVGMKGIQLPPYIGIARLYGVYDYDDYLSKGGRTYQSDRVTSEEDPATNLLKKDANQQTLYIMQDGALDLTHETGDHTYVIPSNAIDHRKSPNYVEGQEFEDFHYIVEATVFGFSKNWINENNYVLARRRTSTFQPVNDAMGANLDTADSEVSLEDIAMVVPCPAGINERIYVAYDRTVYQGDPYMTRAGEVRTVTDYEHRYGTVNPSSAHELSKTIQQFDSNGNFVIETPNKRAFEVLASVDFYTTLGTGKIGGKLFPGTSLDVGHTADNPYAAGRIPSMFGMDVDTPWHVETRTFTEGQKENYSRAEAKVEVLNWTVDNLKDSTLDIISLDGKVTSLTAKTSDDYTGAENEFPIMMSAYDLFKPGKEILIERAEWSSQGGSDWAAKTTFEWEGVRVGDVVTVSTRAASDALIAEGESLWGEGMVKATLLNPYTVVTGHVFADNSVSLFLNSTVEADEPFESVEFSVNDGVIDPDDGSIYNEGFTGGDWTLGNIAKTRIEWDVVQNTTAHLHAPEEASWSPQLEDMVHVSLDTSSDGMSDEQIDFLNKYVSFEAYVSGASEDGDGEITIVAKTFGSGAINWSDSPFYDDDAEDWANHIKLRVRLIPLTDAGHPVAMNTAFLADIRVTQSVVDTDATAAKLADKINHHPDLVRTCTAHSMGTAAVHLLAVPNAAEGNGISLAVRRDNYPSYPHAGLKIHVPYNNALPAKADSVLNYGSNLSMAHFAGGVDVLMNAGNGTSQLNLTGMTERLPLGILLQDSDFLCENPLGDSASAMKTSPTGLRPIQSLLPMTSRGEEYTRFMGDPGELLVMCEGSKSNVFNAFHDADAPQGTKRFRLYRGGGPLFVLSGKNPGGPIDWVSESYPATLQPVLKGGVLACRAMLVRNFPETAFADQITVSEGDEMQMVVITYGHLGDGSTRDSGLVMKGKISPTGYGEGFAAADRYRIEGKPMYRDWTREHPDPDSVHPTVFVEDVD